MHPAVVAGRWFLAFCIAGLSWIVACVAVTLAFRSLFHIPDSNSISGFYTGFYAGTFVGVWAGASTLPMHHRKAFSVMLFAILCAADVGLTWTDIASGKVQKVTFFVILGTVLGIRWVCRTLWPKWSVAPEASRPAKPVVPPRPVEIPAPIAAPAIRNARPAARPVGPPVFGRKR